MDVFQTIIYVGLIFHTDTPCPEVHVHMLSEKMVRIRLTIINETVTELFSFPKGIIWPGRVSVGHNGVVQVQFNKLVHELWEKPYVTKIINQADEIPEHWYSQVIANEPMTHDSSMLSLVYSNKVYNHIYPGRFFQISEHIEGDIRNFTFMAVPMFPLRTLHYPNPGPYDFHSTGESIHAIVKAFPRSSLSGFLSRRTLGTNIRLSNPVGSFCPMIYTNVSSIYSISAGSGVKLILPLMLWLLQANEKLQVSMVVFSRSERDVLWLKDFRQLLNITDFRFQYNIILSHATKLWRGKRGRPNYIWMQRLIPFANETNPDTTIFISGRRVFSNITRTQLSTTHLYPIEKLILFDKVSLVKDYLYKRFGEYYDLRDGDSYEGDDFRSRIVQAL